MQSILMPRVLVRLLERARANSHRSRNGDRVVRVACEHAREEVWTPPWHRIRERFNERFDTQDGRVQFAERECVGRRIAWREVGITLDPLKAFLQPTQHLPRRNVLGLP